MSRLVVERIDRIARRPWLFVSGRLEGEPLRIGDELTVTSDDGVPAVAAIRAIEFHTRPGVTTIAVDEGLRDLIHVGTVLTR
jgi:hypothetical protein